MREGRRHPANRRRGRQKPKGHTADFLDRQASHANRPALFCLLGASAPPSCTGLPSSPALLRRPCSGAGRMRGYFFMGSQRQPLVMSEVTLLPWSDARRAAQKARIELRMLFCCYLILASIDLQSQSALKPTQPSSIQFSSRLDSR